MATVQDDPQVALTAGELLDEVRSARAARDAEEVRILLLAVTWAHRHVVAPPDPEPVQASHLEQRPPCDTSMEDALSMFERLGLPELAWHAGASFAAALGMATASGDRLLRDALILSLRLPLVWARVVAGEVPVWRARRVAEAAVGAPRDVATYLDQETAPIAEKVGTITLDRIIDAAMLQMYPEKREIAQLDALDSRHVTLDESSINHTGIAELTARGDWADLSAFNDTVGDIAALLGRVGADGEHEPIDPRRSMALGVLADPARALALLAGDGDAPATRARVLRVVAHLSEANLVGLDPTASDAQGRGFLSDVFSRWSGRADMRVHVQPVVHCGGCADCTHDTAHTDLDRYQPSATDAAVVQSRDRTCQFPYCHQQGARCDLDHRVPFDHDHPDQGGPTCPCNLAPLCRRHHRLKTHAGWTYTSIEPGVHLWRDRYAQSFLRTRDGTTDLTKPGTT